MSPTGFCIRTQTVQLHQILPISNRHQGLCEHRGRDSAIHIHPLSPHGFQDRHTRTLSCGGYLHPELF